MANPPTTAAIEALAAEIGENIYIDVANWHLYLAEAHLHLPLAEQVYELLTGHQLSSGALDKILGTLPVSLEGGKCQLTLLDLIPTTGQTRLLELLQEYERDFL